MAVIYKLSFANGMAYIGATRQSLAQRMGEHRLYAKEHKQPLYVVWRKYGAPSLRILKHCTNECIEQEEQAAISHHDTLHPNGLNHTIGGVSGAKRTVAAKKRVALGAKKRMTTEKGIAHHRVMTEKAAALKRGQPGNRLGIAHTEATRRKISKATKGRTWSAQRRANHPTSYNSIINQGEL